MEDGACCDRVSLKFGAARWGAELEEKAQVMSVKTAKFGAMCCALVFLPTGSLRGNSSFVSVCSPECFCLTFFCRSRLLLQCFVS